MNMDPRRKAILEKIAKLMALAEGSTYDGERIAARQQIARLMAQYSVELGELRSADAITYRDVKRNAVNTDHNECWLMSAIGKFSGCEVLHTRGYRTEAALHMAYYTIIGREIDIDATVFLYDVICKQIADLLSAFKKRKKGLRANNSYYAGLVSGVEDKLQEITNDVLRYKQEAGLVLVDEFKVRHDDANAWAQARWNIRSCRSKAKADGAAYLAGVADAEQVNVCVPVRKAESGSTLALGGAE